MIHIAIVEDEAQTQEQLIALTRDILSACGKAAQISSFCNADSLLDHGAARFDLILLDIHMPGTDGMTAAQRIRESRQDVLLVFITSMAQYALEGYRVEALDFLVKPVDRPMLEACLSRALRRLDKREPENLTIKSGTTHRRVAIHSIMLAEAQGRHVTLYAAGESIPYSGTLSGLEAELAPHGFFRCHSAFLVSLAHVERIEGSDATVSGIRIPISKHRRKAFLSALAEYWGKQL